jgi:hypothetical protein
MGIIKDVLKSRTINGKEVRLLVDDITMEELTFSVSRDFIKLKIIGSFELFLRWTKKINTANKLKVKHEPSGLLLIDFGSKILEDVVIECEDNNRIEMNLIWGL